MEAAFTETRWVWYPVLSSPYCGSLREEQPPTHSKAQDPTGARTVSGTRLFSLKEANPPERVTYGGQDGGVGESTKPNAWPIPDN